MPLNLEAGVVMIPWLIMAPIIKHNVVVNLKVVCNIKNYAIPIYIITKHLMKSFNNVYIVSEGTVDTNFTSF